MFAKFAKLRADYRNSGSFAVAKAIARSVLSSICDYHIQEVRGRMIRERDPVFSARENDDSNNHTQCVIVDTPEELQLYSSEFRLPFRDSTKSLERRIEQGCVVILARRADQDETCREIVGYSIMERGAFSAAGIKGKISQDVLFVHYTEVAHKYRGQRIAEIITRARNDYCRKRGIRKSCTAHTAGNIPSERAFRKFGSRLLCYAVRVSLLRGLIVWQTPWRKIERAIADLERSERVRAPGSSIAGTTLSH